MLQPDTYVKRPQTARRRTRAVPHTTHADAELDELDVALRNHSVTFHEVARAWFGIHDRELPPERRKRYRARFGRLLDEFADARGGIESDYFCENIRVAAALTDIDEAARLPAGVNKAEAGSDRRRLSGWADRRGRAEASAIHLEPLYGEPDCLLSKRLLSRALDLHYRAVEYLRPEHRKVCLRRVFAAVVTLLGTLDSRAREHARPKLTDKEYAVLSRELYEAERYYEKHALRRAQLWYVTGMVLGMIPLLAFLGGLVWLGGVAIGEPIVVALFAGGLGAIMSVMMRLSRGSLVLEPEATGGVRLVLGSVRPFVGAVFGALLYVLVTSDLLTGVQLTQADVPEYVTFAGLAFLAGFSERAADSVVAQGVGVIAGKDVDPIEPAAAATPQTAPQ